MKVKAALMISSMALMLLSPVFAYEEYDQDGWDGMDERRPRYEREEYYPIYEDGKELFYAGEYDKAIRKFKRVLGISDRNRGANRYLGRIYFKQGDYKKAVDYLEDCLKETSGHYRRQVLYYLARAYESNQQYSKALRIWREYVRRLTPPSDARQKRWLRQAREKVRSLRARLKR